MFLVLALALALGGCSDSAADGPDGWVPPPCPTFGAGEQAGTVDSSDIAEASGVAASRNNPGVLWLNNDSGDSQRIFAMSADGTHLGIYNLSGASADDYEDIAADDTYLYVGDIGDNFMNRSHVVVYRVAEPEVSVHQAPVTQDLTGVEAMELEYPDRAHDSETLLIDPLRGDLYLVTKEFAGDSFVFLAARPFAPGTRIVMEEVYALPFGSNSLPGSFLTTGGDVSPSGEAVLIRTYSSAFFWWRLADRPLWTAFDGPACEAPVMAEPQGEAICFASDFAGYFTVSEGEHPPVYYHSLDPP